MFLKLNGIYPNLGGQGNEPFFKIGAVILFIAIVISLLIKNFIKILLILLFHI